MSDWAVVARDVATATRGWDALAAIGVPVRRSSDGWQLGPWPHDPIEISRQELVVGISTQLEASDRGREWAGFLLAASELFEIRDDDVLEALWDMSSGDVTAAEALRDA